MDADDPLAERVAALEACVAADPGDLLARLLLGREVLSAGRFEDAARHLRAYVEGMEETADTGAAWLSLAQARLGTGDVAGARAALDRAERAAAAHRHLGLLEGIAAERAGLDAS